MANPYDPDRIKKIASIMPQMFDLIQPNDEVQFGLVGDPCFPASFRGTDRPTGRVETVTGERGSRIATIKMSNGDLQQVQEDDTSSTRLFELSDRGFKGVMERKRKEVAAASAVSSADEPAQTESSEFRGLFGNDMKKELKELREIVESTDKRLKGYAATTNKAMGMLAEDVTRLHAGAPIRFSGALIKALDGLNKSTD